MAHFESASPRKRISVSTVFLQPKQTIELAVSGYIAGLSVRSTDDTVVKVSTPLGSNGRCAITAVDVNKLEVPRIELVMSGGAVWDYFEASAISGPLPAGWQEINDYVHPGNRTVMVTTFWARNANPNVLGHAATVARLILGQHGLNLQITPGVQPSAQHTIPFDKEISTLDDVKAIREQAASTGLTSDNRLVVIAVRYSDMVQGTPSPYGQTFLGFGRFVRPFVFINSAKISPTAVTLLHEIGHAALGAGHEHAGKTAVVANVMDEALHSTYKSTGTNMNRKQVVGIAGAFFTRA